MRSSLTIAGLTISPPLFLAPLAGITHSALRRLVAGYGGYGALYTEMLSARALLHENLQTSPFTRRRAEEGNVIYQLQLTGEEPIEQVVKRLLTIQPCALDINCGCPAPMIARRGGGFGLFASLARLESTVERVRACWPGPLLVKCRLGASSGEWEEELGVRLRILERIGIDALVLHPRFADEKLKRGVRWEAYERVRTLTALPVIANGDITGPQTFTRRREPLRHTDGAMIGRMAVVRPWIFADCSGRETGPDYQEAWERLIDYVCEDFSTEKRLGRIREFTAWYSRNFMFGHQLFAAIQGAPDLADARRRGEAFFERSPAPVQTPSLAGV